MKLLEFWVVKIDQAPPLHLLCISIPYSNTESANGPDVIQTFLTWSHFLNMWRKNIFLMTKVQLKQGK